MIDLTTIPERFHILFSSDWNKGNDSSMNSVQRGLMNELFLEYHHWDVKQQIMKNDINDNEHPFQGFVKD
jgi:hypothetical protein